MTLILGSQSPRREEILRFFSIPFIQIASPFDERSVPFDGNPKQYAQTLALKKGKALAISYPNDLILTADTIVFQEGALFNKPKDREEAVFFLKNLQGTWHSVFTALALSYKGMQDVRIEETRLLFTPLSDRQIANYLDHINFLDKAGGYAAQRGGSLLIQKIEGSYYNVIGLPLGPLQELLQIGGIDLWDHLTIL